MGTGGKKAVFLDRDGTVNIEKDYLCRVEDFEFISGVPEAIRLLNEAGFLVVIVTNQSGIARGYYSEEDLEHLHSYMDQELTKTGTSIDAYYYCPHHPINGIGEYLKDCDCRKPLPGMLIRAAEDLDIDMASSFMIGDKIADIEAGLAAGCTSILVLTGYGASEQCAVPSAVPVAENLLEAVRLVLAQNC